MKDHFHLSDTQFEHDFEHCLLDPSVFNHEAHLRLAWILIKKYGIHEAIHLIIDQLKAFTRHVGAEEKFNLTLTIAAIKAVNHFVLRSQSNSFKGFIAEFPQLKYNFKELMASHYSLDIYNAMEAKTQFIQPDLLPFD